MSSPYYGDVTRDGRDRNTTGCSRSSLRLGPGNKVEAYTDYLRAIIMINQGGAMVQLCMTE